MKIKFKFGILIISLSSLLGCITNKYAKPLISISFIEKENTTRYEVSPYGFVNIPGKWDEISFDEKSNTQFFTNKDSSFLSIAIGLENRYDFYKVGEADFPFLKDFYERSSKNLVKITNGERKIIEQDSISLNYIIWHISNNSKVNSYLLFGLKKGIVYNLFLTNDKWNEQQKIELLKILYKNSK